MSESNEKGETGGKVRLAVTGLTRRASPAHRAFPAPLRHESCGLNIQ